MKMSLPSVSSLVTFGTSGALWAASEVMPDAVWKTILNAGGFGVMAMMLYRIHCAAIKTHAETLKDALAAFREEIGLERKECNARLDAIRGESEKEQAEMRQTIRDAFTEATRQFVSLIPRTGVPVNDTVPPQRVSPPAGS